MADNSMITTADADIIREEKFYEAEVFGQGGEREYKLKADDWMMDYRYRALNSIEIQRLFYSVDNDDTVQVVRNVFNSTLFSGGVHMKRGDASMDDTSARWYSQTYCSFGEALDRSLTAVDFAACSWIPHNQYVGVPTVLDMKKIHILYRKDVYSQGHFVFFEKMGVGSGGFLDSMHKNGSLGTSKAMYKYIPGVVVYHDGRFPDENGTFSSKMTLLDRDRTLDNNNMFSQYTANIQRASPPVFLEAVTQAHDPNALTSTIQPGVSYLLGDGTGPAGYHMKSESLSNDSSEAAQRNAETFARKQHLYATVLLEHGKEGLDRVSNMAKNQIDLMSDNGMRQIYLDEGRRYVSPQMPEGPGQFTIDFRVAKLEMTCLLLGMPLSMVSQSSSLGGKTSMNENSFTIFTHTQKRKKQLLLSFMHDMYERIYAPHHALQRLESTPVDKLEDAMSSMQIESTGVQILMPGLPEDATLDKIYLQGVLKYDAYCDYMSSRHSIPRECFESSAKVSLDDLNGVKPEPTAASKPKPKAKAKK